MSQCTTAEFLEVFHFRLIAYGKQTLYNISNNSSPSKTNQIVLRNIPDGPLMQADHIAEVYPYNALVIRGIC